MDINVSKKQIENHFLLIIIMAMSDNVIQP